MAGWQDVPTVTGMPASLRTSRVGRVTKPAPSISTLLQADKSPCQPPSGMRPRGARGGHGALSLGVGWAMHRARHWAVVGRVYCCEAIFSRSDRSRVCLLAVLWCACAVRRAVLCSQAISWIVRGNSCSRLAESESKPRRLVFVLVGSTGGFRLCQFPSRRLSQAGPLPSARPGFRPACCPYRVQSPALMRVPITAPNFKEG